MKEINLSFNRKARIWFEEIQKVCFDSTNTLEKSYENVGKNSYMIKQENFIVELKISAGGRTIYGLLGAKFKSHPINVFSKEILSSDSKEKSFSDSMYKGLDGAYVGLPTAYLDAVKTGILKYFDDENNIKPNGKIIFKYAAYSEVGSNEIIFENLAYIISNYFFSNKKFGKELDYINLFSIVE